MCFRTGAKEAAGASKESQSSSELGSSVGGAGESMREWSCCWRRSTRWREVG